MAKNITARVPAFVVAKQTISFSAAGLNASNVYSIVESGPTGYRSWSSAPGVINPISGFTGGRGYLINPKTDLDISAIVTPPGDIVISMPITQGISNPSTLSYNQQASSRPNNFVDPKSIQADLNFNTGDYLGTPVRFSGSGAAPAKGYANNVYSITTSGSTAHFLQLQNIVFDNIFKGMTIELASMPELNGSALASFSNRPTNSTKFSFGMMILKDASNAVGMGHNFTTNTAEMTTVIGGATTYANPANGTATVGQEPVDYGTQVFTGTPSKMHVGYGYNMVFLWLENTAGQIFYQGKCNITFDYATVSNIQSNMKVGVYVNTTGTSSKVNIKRITYGVFGSTGFCNPRIVTLKHGDPYIKDGKVYVVANAAMGGGEYNIWANFANAIYAVDIQTKAMERVGMYNFIHDGHYTLDGVGKVIYDEDAGLFRIVNQAMSNLPSRVNLIYGETDAYILEGNHTVVARQIPLFDSGTNFSYYDPDFVFCNNAWHILCARQDYTLNYPLAYCAKTTNFQTYTKVWNDTSAARPANGSGFEGGTVARINGIYYAFMPQQNDPNANITIWNLATGALIGAFTHPSPYTFASGHWAVFPESRDGKTYFHAITHKGTFQYGGNDFGEYQAFQATQTQTGYEFPVRNMPR